VIRMRPLISAEFRHALDQQVMIAERLRIKVLLSTTLLLMGTLTVVHTISPEGIDRLWNGNFGLRHMYAIFLPFILFECIALFVLSRKISHHDELPFWRRYLSAFVEASVPSIALIVHINGMERTAALGFVAPMAYFLFIILSTLRLDFWLSAFTG